MQIHKLKTVQVLSNGSVSFSYKTCNNFKLFDISEKDFKNFHLNVKMKSNLQTNRTKNSGYKNKYLITK